MPSELSRYEINRKIRQVLVSHNADMTKISYSFVHRTVYVSGSLVRESQGEFSLSERFAQPPLLFICLINCSSNFPWVNQP
jgi:hypothetical protein